MFTGIITEIGSARAISRSAAGCRLDLACRYAGLMLGESIAVNGVCLTVAQIVGGGFVADASAETLARTTLGDLTVGERVNLERALAVGDRLGGHIVAGHVDGVGRVVARERVSEAERWRFAAPPAVLRFLAEKGSVAIDGVSLTVNAVGPSDFEVMLVPFTLGATTLAGKRANSAVNLEVDLLARYVARALESGREPGGITLDFLGRHGFAPPGAR